MKQFLPLFMCVLLACTKDVSSPPVQDQAQTQIDLARKTAARKSKPKTESYTYTYQGDSGEGFDITFDPFDFNDGTLTAWTLTINRQVTGSLTITNTAGKQNASTISISRYTVVTMGNTVLGTMPTAVVKNIGQTIGNGKTLTVPINTNITDVVNSTPTTLGLPVGDDTGEITWHFNDLVSAFKPNCNNSYTLGDNVTVTVTYTYISN